MFYKRDPYCEDGDEFVDDFNDYSFSQYIQAHIFWGLIFAYVYCNLLFRCIPDFDIFCSGMILAGIVIVVCMIGIFFQYKKDRFFIEIMANLFIGFGIYTVISYISIKPTFITAALIISGGITLLNALLICMKKIRNKRKARRIIAGRIRKVFVGSWGIYGYVFTGLLIIMAVNRIFSGSIGSAIAQVVVNRDRDGMTIGNSMDILVNLDERKWEGLDQKERLNVLQRIVNIERNYMGIDHNILVNTKELPEDSNTGAYYDENTHSITVNLDALINDTPYYLCNAMCHETRHAEQFIITQIYDAADERIKKNSFFDQAVRMKKEFYDYTSVEDDFYKYYGQECERDARSYAEGRAEVYFNALEDYICETTELEVFKEYKRTVDEAGNWSIINGKGREIFTGADKINDLHEGLKVVTAVADGRALILSLPADPDGQVDVKKAFDRYRDITDIFCDSFAIVTDMEGNEGVVDLSGKVVIPTDYARITYSEQYITDDGRHGIKFCLRQSDLTGDIITLELDSSDMTAWADLAE